MQIRVNLLPGTSRPSGFVKSRLLHLRELRRGARTAVSNQLKHCRNTHSIGTKVHVKFEAILLDGTSRPSVFM
jgi:hypothetical protein